jgi:heptaprenyl diphosphate synthase
MKKRAALRLTRIAVYTAVALILFAVESLLPPIFPFAPGVKLGLSNVVTLLAVVTLGYLDAGAVLLTRCLLGAAFGGNVFGLVYSLGGGLAAYAVMCLLYRFALPKISLLSVSVCGAVVHNAVQTAIAALIVSQINYVLLLPLLLIASVIAGLLTGETCRRLVRSLPQRLFIAQNAAVSEAAFGDGG